MDSKIFSYVPSVSPSSTEGPLADKFFTIQPNMSVRGWPTNAGSQALEGFVPLETSTAIERIQAQAGRVVGSTLMPELGLGLRPDTAAAAIRDRHCDVALVTDLMGESRFTASEAGAFGFKPSYGLVSRFGLIGLVPSMEAFGLVSRSLPDISRALAAMAGPDDRDTSMVEGKIPDFSQVGSGADRVKRIGVIRESVASLSKEAAGEFRESLAGLENLGAQIEELSWPDHRLFRLVHNLVGATEASSSAGKYDGVRYGHRAAESANWNEMYLRSRAECFGVLVKSYLFQGAYFQFERFSAFQDACRIRRRLVEGMDAFFDRVDLIASPLPRTAISKSAGSGTLQEVYDTFACSLAPNVTGQPCLGVPGLSRRGAIQVNLQLSGRFGDDVRLLSFGSRLTAGK
jgi:aspartyl-tRNA(Asn)/glutamyl-tRNA(Gln) amidotransferase subunit A